MREVIERLEAGIAERVANTVMLPVADAEALLRLARAVGDAPEGRVYVIGTGDGDDLLTIDPRDRQDRETVRDMAGTRVRLVAAPDGE